MFGLGCGVKIRNLVKVGLKPFADASLSFKIATTVLYLSLPVFFYSLFKWAGTREYAVPVAHHHLTKYDNGFMGMSWFIISEVGLFAVLIAGYVYLRMIGHAEPPALRPALWLAALNTLILVTSSGVIALINGSWTPFWTLALPAFALMAAHVWLAPGARVTRIWASLMMMTIIAVTIHQSRGLVEMHFGIFVVLAVYGAVMLVSAIALVPADRRGRAMSVVAGGRRSSRSRARSATATGSTPRNRTAAPCPSSPTTTLAHQCTP